MAGPVCLIVGTGPGVSLAVARRFGRESYRIAMIARTSDSLASAHQALASEGIAAKDFRADAGDDTALRAAIDEVRAALGDPDVAVYNASAGHAGVPTSLTREDLIRDFDVNVTGAIVTAQECAPAMIKAGKGTILITGGGLALEPSVEIASLSLGKAAIRSLSFSLANELGPRGIHVATVTICGFVQPGTHFAADLIAEEYWRLHNQAPSEWEREIVIR